MTPSELGNEIDKIIQGVTDQYASEIEAVQQEIYNKLVRILKNLELDSEGYIKQSSANRAILNDAESALDDLLPGSSFTQAVSNVLNAVPVIDAANIEYFSSSETFNENRNFIKSLQSRTIKSIESTLLEDGLTAQIKNPLSDILNRNVNSGGQFSGFLEEVRNFVTGTDRVDGKILSYSRTYLSDTLFNYSRAYQESITNDLKLDWYLWAGGLTDTSRPFCIHNAGQYFHRKEIEAMADQEWAGKRQGTTKSSIFIFVGGYGCKHSLIPVHDSIVPKERLSEFVASA